MAELNPNTIGRLKFGTRAATGFLTPPAGQLLLAAESTNGHLVQKDSTGKLIDLAAVDSQEDSVGFDATVIWNFDATTEGWTALNGTAAFDTANGKGLLLTDNAAASSSILSPAGLSINGNLYRRVKASITLVALPAPVGGPAQPRLLYSTGGHGISESYRKIVTWPVPMATVGDTVILDFDMETAEGAPDWQTGTITQLRLFLTDTTPVGTVLRINWVAVGRNAPPQSSIQFKDEGVAVSSAGYIKNVDFTGNVTASASGDTLTVNVPAGAGTGDVTQSVNSSASGKLKISAAADKSITDYSGTSALLKVDASSILANAVAGTDYFPPATNAGVDNGDIILDDSASPVTPPAGSLKLIAQSEVTLSTLRAVNYKGQNWRVWLEGRYAARFQAMANSNALTGHCGLLFAATGTATAAASSNTSRYTRTARVEALVTTAAATAVAGLRPANSMLFTGAGTVDGGFWMRLIAGPATGVATASSRFWMGAGQTTAPTDVEPSSINNTIGVGYDSADTNLQIMTKGTGAVVKTDTGIAVPTTDRSALYEIIVFLTPGATQEAFIQVTDIINGTVFSKSETTAGNLPATGVSLVPKVYSSAGGTSSVIGVALHSCFVTSDF